MSAMLGVRDKDAIHILTDAAATYVKSGIVAELGHKQIKTRSRALVAGSGLWSPVLRFVRLADERAKTFDELVAIAPDLWDEARAHLPAGAKDRPHAALLAGWSEKDARLRMHILQHCGEESGVWLDGGADGPRPAYATGPDESAQEFVDLFAKCVSHDREAFDPCSDGIVFMEHLRRHCPRKFELAERPAVGGFVTHSTVTREAIRTRIIYEWPADVIGKPIDASAIGLNMGTLRDAAASFLQSYFQAQRTP